MRITDFKTTWSELQKHSHSATEQSEAELRTLNFKTTWSEFQKPSQTTPRVYTILKKDHLPRVGPKQLCASAHLGSTRAAGTS